MFKLVLSCFLFSFSSVTLAEPYIRFWQGYKLPGLSSTSFLHGLNTQLLPETGKLAATAARLEEYLPVVLSPAKAQALGLPDEVALVIYNNKEDYQKYRQTPEGVAYGDLHWKFFERSLSRSRESVPFHFNVLINGSYYKFSPRFNWHRGFNFFQVFKRSGGSTDGSFENAISRLLTRMLGADLQGFVVSVNKDSVVLYTNWKTWPTWENFQDSSENLVSVERFQLRKGTSLQFGSGLLFAK